MIFLLEFLYNMLIVYFFCLELVIFNVELFCLNFMESYFIFGLWGFSFIRIKLYKYVKDVILSRDIKVFYNNCVIIVII